MKRECYSISGTLWVAEMYKRSISMVYVNVDTKPPWRNLHELKLCVCKILLDITTLKGSQKTTDSYSHWIIM